MESEEAHRNSSVVPLNMQPGYQASRDVFEEFQGAAEEAQLRLKPKVPSNEVMCVPKDDIGRSCPSLLPPEPTVVPPYYFGGNGYLGHNTWMNFAPTGDGYVANFGMNGDSSPQGMLTIEAYRAGIQEPNGGVGGYPPQFPQQFLDGYGGPLLGGGPQYGGPLLGGGPYGGPQLGPVLGGQQLLPPPMPQYPVPPRQPGRWYLPRVPSPAKLRAHGQPGMTLGPVDGAADPTVCTTGAGSLRLGMGVGGAGAVTSIRWGGVEFLNRPARARYGHGGGRSSSRASALQVSVASNIPPGGTDQQRRANEAGSAWNQGGATTSRLVALASGKVGPNKLAAYTRTQAAWWRKPGVPFGQFRVLNTMDISPFVVTKRVTLGPDSFKYVSAVEVPPAERAVSLRIATRLAVAPQFNRALGFHYPTQRWVVLSRSRTLPVGTYRALCVTNADGTAAIGFSLMDFPKAPRGYNFGPKAFYAVNVTNSSAGTLLGAVHQVGVRGGAQLLPATTFAYHQHFEVGTLEKVSRTLANLAINLTDHSQLVELPRGWTADNFGPKCVAPPQKVWVDNGIVNDPGAICGPSAGALAAADLNNPVNAAGNKWHQKLLATGWRHEGGVWRHPTHNCLIKQAAEARCKECNFRNIHLARCENCMKCAPKGAPGADGMTWHAQMLAQGWRQINGTWKHANFDCTVKSSLARCAGCNFQNLDLPECQNCIHCVPKSLAQINADNAAFASTLPATINSVATNPWHGKLLATGWRNNGGVWQHATHDCTIKTTVPRCAGCTFRNLHTAGCTDCMHCVPKGTVTAGPGGVPPVFVPGTGLNDPASAVGNTWHQKLLATGWQNVNGVWTHATHDCAIKRALPQCANCNFQNLHTAACANCMNCVPKPGVPGVVVPSVAPGTGLNNPASAAGNPWHGKLLATGWVNVNGTWTHATHDCAIKRALPQCAACNFQNLHTAACANCMNCVPKPGVVVVPGVTGVGLNNPATAAGNPWHQKMLATGWQHVNGVWTQPTHTCAIKTGLARCKGCNFTNLHTAVCVNCVNCVPKAPGGQVVDLMNTVATTPWHQKLLATGWMNINGTWQHATHACTIKAALPRCKLCTFQNLHTAQCADCIDCRLKTPAEMAEGTAPINTAPTNPWHTKLLATGWRFAGGKWVAPDTFTCSIRTGQARCAGCNLTNLHTVGCTDCVNCVAKSGDALNTAGTNEWHNQILANGWRFINGKWQHTDWTCAVKSVPTCVGCSMKNLHELRCKDCVNCTPKPTGGGAVELKKQNKHWRNDWRNDANKW